MGIFIYLAVRCAASSGTDCRIKKSPTPAQWSKHSKLTMADILSPTWPMTAMSVVLESWEWVLSIRGIINPIGGLLFIRIGQKRVKKVIGSAKWKFGFAAGISHPNSIFDQNENRQHDHRWKALFKLYRLVPLLLPRYQNNNHCSGKALANTEASIGVMH